MELDYRAIGERIARRRKKQRLTQAVVAERCEISDQYLSNIERAASIPSTEVIMRLAMALDTTPDEFLVGTAHREGEEWRSVADRLRGLTPRQLKLADQLIEVAARQEMGEEEQSR